MLTKKQLKILEPMTKDLFREYMYKELKSLSHEKSGNGFQLALNKFKEENLITERRIGTSALLKANLQNELLYNYISIINLNKLPKKQLETVHMLKNEIEKDVLFYSLVVFGSHADNTQTSKSDLDMAIFVANKEKETEIKIAINTIKKMSLIEMDCHIITEGEFLDMLRADYTNVGKLMATKNLPLINAGIFYKLLSKGVEHGFKH